VRNGASPVLNKKIMDMDALDFVSNYHEYLNEIREVIRPGLEPILEELDDTDPHDLVRPDSIFLNETAMRGLVWSLFLHKAKNRE